MAPHPARLRCVAYAVTEPRDDLAFFSVVELDSGELAGEALLWAIDLHNRMAHLGLSLRPAFRGRGLGTDVVLALCGYGFTIRGLHRLQVDTLASNTAMIRAASRAGFVQEGRLRRSAWVSGDFADEVILGMLATDWVAGETRANGRGRDRRQPRLTARGHPALDRRDAPTVMSGLKPGHHFPTS